MNDEDYVVIDADSPQEAMLKLHDAGLEPVKAEPYANKRTESGVRVGVLDRPEASNPHQGSEDAYLNPDAHARRPGVGHQRALNHPPFAVPSRADRFEEVTTEDRLFLPVRTGRIRCAQDDPHGPNPTRAASRPHSRT